MKTNISFITKQDNFIYSIDNAKDYFKVGDKMYFNIEDIYPITITKLKEKYNSELVKSILTGNKSDIENYGRIRWKIISKYISLSRNENLDGIYTLNIEYTVKPSPRFYWKWWYIKSLIKKII